MRLTRIGRLSLGVLAGSTLAGGLLGGSVLAGGGKLNDELRLYTSILSAIQQDYVEEVPAERLVAASVRELLRSLDPHSNFLETREYSSLQERQKGSYYGLGIQVPSIPGKPLDGQSSNVSISSLADALLLIGVATLVRGGCQSRQGAISWRL